MEEKERGCPICGCIEQYKDKDQHIRCCWCNYNFDDVSKDEKELDLQQWQIDLLTEHTEWLQSPEGRTTDREKIHKKIDELFAKHAPRTISGSIPKKGN